MHASILIGSYERKPRTDVATYAAERRSKQMANLREASATELKQVEVDGKPAWQTEVRGIVPTTKNDTTYLITVIDNGLDIVYLNTLVHTDVYLAHKAEMQDIAYDLCGLSLPMPAQLL